MSGIRWTAPLLCAAASGCLGGSVSLTEGPGDPAPASTIAPPVGVSLHHPETLEYTVAYGGVPAGFLTLEALPAPAPVLQAQGGTNAVFDLVYPVQAEVSCLLDASGRPAVFDVEYHENGDARLRHLRFGEVVTLSWRDGDLTSPHEFVVETARAVDPLTFLWLLRQRRPTRAEDFEVLAGLHPDTYRVQPLGRAEVEVPVGQFPDALAYRIEVLPRNSETPRASFEVFLEGTGDHRPLLVRRRIGLATLTVTLTRSVRGVPGPAAPAASTGE